MLKSFQVHGNYSIPFYSIPLFIINENITLLNDVSSLIDFLVYPHAIITFKSKDDVIIFLYTSENNGNSIQFNYFNSFTANINSCNEFSKHLNMFIEQNKNPSNLKKGARVPFSYQEIKSFKDWIETTSTINNTFN
ncbi:hypothetical protein CYY_003861 [Polysphondylium violaceum]|uniref:Uncharacterized protein n=1 Tax=Polysphondylium violaceum TaxID=133409 RepID=A0A8J4UZT7_9MYCE|nr:hypothetical protein CYY_003861 [Polysphondylium violaceum]